MHAVVCMSKDVTKINDTAVNVFVKCERFSNAVCNHLALGLKPLGLVIISVIFPEYLIYIMIKPCLTIG